MEDLESELIVALLEDAKDEEYLEKIALWDCVVGNGITPNNFL